MEQNEFLKPWKYYSFRNELLSENRSKCTPLRGGVEIKKELEKNDWVCKYFFVFVFMEEIE